MKLSCIWVQNHCQYHCECHTDAAHRPLLVPDTAVWSCHGDLHAHVKLSTGGKVGTLYGQQQCRSDLTAAFVSSTELLIWLCMYQTLASEAVCTLTVFTLHWSDPSTLSTWLEQVILRPGMLVKVAKLSDGHACVLAIAGRQTLVGKSLWLLMALWKMLQEIWS